MGPYIETMKFELKIFQNRVARRVFGFFALSALAPLGVALFLSFNHVTSQLTDQSRAGLRDASKSFGMALYERLLVAEGDIREVADRLLKSHNQIPTPINRHFASLTLVDAGGEMRSLAGIAMGAEDAVASIAENTAGDVTMLRDATVGRSQPRIFMSRMLDANNPSQGVLVGEINAGYIWGDPLSYPQATQFCVLTERNLPLFCSAAVPNSVFQRVASFDQQTTSFEWEHDEDQYLGQFWTLFLKAHFASSPWTIISFQRESDALHVLGGFKFIYVSVVLITVLLIALLSMIQLRRGLVPLARLVEGTRRIAHRDFASRVQIDSGDEFEELAASVNYMAKRLGKQFRALAALSELDRSILSSFDLDPVIDLALKRLPKLVDCDCLAISLFDRDAPNVARVYYRDRKRGGYYVKRILVSLEARQKLLGSNKRVLNIPEDVHVSYLEPLKKWGAKYFHVLPVVIDDRLGSLISLGYRARLRKSSDALTTAKDFADRLAVAISTVESEEKLYYQAHYDSLTTLPNRQLFKDRLEQEVLRARRSAHKMALLFIDLDHFKNVNDSRGHSVGDKLLQQAAERLQAAARETDTVARLGGDEFTVIVPDLTSTQTAANVGRRILEEFSRPFEIDGQRHFVTASAGIAIFPLDGSNSEELLQNADTAMYRAKDIGRAHFSFFTPSMNAEATRKIELESELRQALEQDEFTLHYQPVVDLQTNDVIAAEALIRWHHPDRGLVPPSEFIPAAEEMGLIEGIGEWALHSACKQYLTWRAEGLPLQRIAVNVSPKQLLSQDFVKDVRAMLTELDMPAESLEIEITENVLLQEEQRGAVTITELQRMGLHISIDDFGTGYSSLSYLNRLAVQVLKIDRSFIRNIMTDDNSKALVTAIISMALSLGKTVIAEGIESEEQAAFLTSQQCHRGQGNYYSEPLDPAQFTAWLANPEAGLSETVARKTADLQT